MRSKKAIKNIISSLLLQFVTIICGFIVPKLIIENFGSDVNGLVTSITQFLAYITLLDSGIGQVIKALLYKPISNNSQDEIKNILKAAEKFFKTIAYIFIVYIFILCIAFPNIMRGQFDVIYTLSLVIIISISTFAEYFIGMTYKIFLQAKQEVYVISIIQIFTTILNTILIVILIWCGANIQVVKFVSAIIFVLRPVLQNIYVKKKYNIKLNDADKNYKLEQKWDGLAQHIASVIHNNTDISILTLFCEITEVSVYSVHLLVINGVKKVVEALTGGIDATFGDMIARKEKEHLNKSFKVYELFYMTLITILFAVTFILIVPFIDIYTKGITDVNYYRPIFARIMVIAELIYVIRLPYNAITFAAGRFKQTRNGAILEAILNLIISIILVIKLGIVGVAIGTLIAMMIRTIEFIVYASKYILERSIMFFLKRIILIIIQFIIIVIFGNIILPQDMNSYMNWIVYAIIITIFAALVCVISNFIIYKEDCKGLLDIIKRNIKREKYKDDSNGNTW